ncbi:MAG: glycosyltransferase family 39 protein [Desulfobacterales bacterium]|nr:glycosyltransferase family 39 protein [Desulfobacterales bacterium]
MASLTVYSKVVPSYFMADDFGLIAGVSEDAVETYHVVQKIGFLRPVIILSYFTDYKIWKFNALGFHLTNVLFHALNSVLVSALTLILIKFFSGTTVLNKKNLLISSFAGLFFLVLPCHSESVSWIAGRTDVIAATFILLSLISSCYYLMKPDLRALVAALASFCLALYSKESAIPVPFIILLFAVIQKYLYPGKISILKIIQIFAMFACVETAYFIHRFYALGTFVGGYGTSAHTNFAPDIVLDHFARFTIRTFLSPLSQEHASLLSHNNLKFMGIVEIICFLTGTAVIMFILKSGKFHELVNTKKAELFLLVTLFGCFGLSLAPVISLDVSLFDTQNERLLYFPSVFASIGTVCCIALLMRSMAAWVPVLCFLIVFSGFNLYKVNLNWAEAGRITKNIALSFAEHVVGNYIMVINAPDNIKGAYISRNGIGHDLLTKFMNRDIILAVNLISLHNINSLDEEFKLVIKQKDSKPHFFFSLNENTRFYYVNNDNKYVTVNRSESGKDFEFYFKDHSEQFNIFTYSSGTMKKVLLPEYEKANDKSQITNNK